MKPENDLAIQAAKGYLSKPCQTDQTIRIKLEQLAHLRSVATLPSIQYHHAKRQSTALTDRMAENVTKIISLQEEIAEDIKALSQQKRHIDSLLHYIRDARVRSVIEQRYLCMMTWADIAATLNCTTRQAFNLNRRGLEAVSEALLKNSGAPCPV